MIRPVITQLFDADGTIVVDTCLFGSIQLFVGTLCYPLASQFPVAEADGTDGAGGVAVLAYL